MQNCRFGLNFQKGMFLDLISFSQENNCCSCQRHTLRKSVAPTIFMLRSWALGEGKFDPVFGAQNDRGKYLLIDDAAETLAKNTISLSLISQKPRKWYFIRICVSWRRKAVTAVTLVALGKWLLNSPYRKLSYTSDHGDIHLFERTCTARKRLV